MAATAVQHIALCQLNPFNTRDFPYDYNGHGNNPYLAPMPEKPFPPDSMEMLFGALLGNEPSNEHAKIIHHLDYDYDPRSSGINADIPGTRWRGPMGGPGMGGRPGGGGGDDDDGGGGGGPGGPSDHFQAGYDHAVSVNNEHKRGRPSRSSQTRMTIGPGGPYGGPGGGLGGARADFFNIDAAANAALDPGFVADDPRRQTSTFVGVNLEAGAPATAPEDPTAPPLPGSPAASSGGSSQSDGSGPYGPPGARVGRQVGGQIRRAAANLYNGALGYLAGMTNTEEQETAEMANAHAHNLAANAGATTVAGVVPDFYPEEQQGRAEQGRELQPAEPQFGEPGRAPRMSMADVLRWRPSPGRAVVQAEPQVGRSGGLQSYGAGGGSPTGTYSSTATSRPPRGSSSRAPTTAAQVAAAPPRTVATPRAAAPRVQATTTRPAAPRSPVRTRARTAAAAAERVAAPAAERSPRAQPTVNQRNEVAPPRRSPPREEARPLQAAAEAPVLRRRRRTEAELLQEYTATSNNTGKRGTVARTRNGR